MVDPLSMYKSGAPIISVDGSEHTWNKKRNKKSWNVKQREGYVKFGYY